MENDSLLYMCYDMLLAKITILLGVTSRNLVEI
jgi:hypothetical protein